MALYVPAGLNVARPCVPVIVLFKLRVESEKCAWKDLRMNSLPRLLLLILLTCDRAVVGSVNLLPGSLWVLVVVHAEVPEDC